ncbi:hypothetical protein [Flavobacterium sp.]|uniref:hypothetical protein n=1 Tax=Flavobacterium sp. TaxID=239 RepID=UPI004034A992
MRRKKIERIKEEKFWENFFYFNVPEGIDELPRHLDHVRFRLYGVDDEGIAMMVPELDSITMLDLDETDITNDGIMHLTKLHFIKEMRLKGCDRIDDACIPFINKIKGLELLHLCSTPITTDGILRLFLPGLKQLFISAEYDEDTKVKLQRLCKAFPDCEVVVNHKLFEDYLTRTGW